jgi:protein TonB
MSAQRAVPLADPLDSANERFKGRFRSLLWSSMIVAAGVHFVTFAYWPELTAEDFSFTSVELESIELPPEVEIPPAPKSIARPATPVMATTEIDETITIAPTTFEDNPVEKLPPPPTGEAQVELSDQPTFTPFTVAPEIANRKEVLEAMVASYPPLLRDAGIGGIVRVYFFIDENGVVQKFQVNQSSGHKSLDDAALAVASLYRFSPALNRDTRVPVWVSFPIEFRVAN